MKSKITLALLLAMIVGVSEASNYMPNNQVALRNAITTEIQSPISCVSISQRYDDLSLHSRIQSGVQVAVTTCWTCNCKYIPGTLIYKCETCCK